MDLLSITAIFFIIIFFECILIIGKKRILEKQENITDSKSINYSNYHKKMLLTKTEYSFFMKIRPSLQEKNLFLYPKIRLEDFIEATGEKKEKQSLRGRIKSRHIDFLVCDDKLHIKAAIELDDKSHSGENAQKVDQFKNDLFRSINIPLIRIQVKPDYTNDIALILSTLQISAE